MLMFIGNRMHHRIYNSLSQQLSEHMHALYVDIIIYVDIIMKQIAMHA